MALWLVVAAACIYVMASRFYGRWISRRVVELNDQRVTPAVGLNDGVNFHPTNKYELFGITSRRLPERRLGPGVLADCW